MAEHNDLGRLGEDIAAAYLQHQGFELLARNWRWGKAEIDLILRDKAAVVFVEVKTRRNARYGFPEESVGPKKEKLLAEAAGQYLYENQFEGEFRFDVVAIIAYPTPQVRHFPDAFFPFYCDAEPDAQPDHDGEMWAVRF